MARSPSRRSPSRGPGKALVGVAIIAFLFIGIVLMRSPQDEGASGGGGSGPGGQGATPAAALEGGEFPEPEGFVNDFADVIPSEDEAVIQGIAEAIQRETGAEIAVVTVASMAPYPTIEDFGIALADQWGVGPAESDAGVILMVAVEERRFRIEVGYGLEGAIPDGRAGAIRDDFVIPYLSENNYGEGLRNGVAAVAQLVANEYGVEISDIEVRRPQPARGADSGGSALGSIVPFVLFMFFFGGRWIFLPLLFGGRRRMFYGGGYRSGGFGSGGFSSGGFGGFGGGGFGGGGASGGF